MQSNLGIVYDLSTGRIKRVIYPDNDLQLVTTLWYGIHLNEGYIILPKTAGNTEPALQAALNEELRKK